MLCVAVNIPDRLYNFIYFKGNFDSSHVLNFDFWDNDDFILSKHILELLINSSFKKEHVNFTSLAI